ncbi:azolemycin family RiPP peptide [Actinacidiphila oryziradicis]|uniref:Azolemycin family RiPP peptide n=1 Tax=Actinacidiphila oryziradicis TaxID=2571141 RepID=A0A4V5MYH3_9ACTN|nr:azolemycin family RiPP peptide [Actinacidiphila oryziradicis]
MFEEMAIPEPEAVVVCSCTVKIDGENEEI